METTPTHISTNVYKFKNFVFRNDSSFSLRAALQDPQGNTSSHQHEFTECAIVVRGTGAHQSNSNPYCPIATGDVLVIPPGGFHSYGNTVNLAIVNLMFDTEKLPPVLMELYSNPVYKRVFLRNAASYVLVTLKSYKWHLILLWFLLGALPPNPWSFFRHGHVRHKPEKETMREASSPGLRPLVHLVIP